MATAEFKKAVIETMQEERQSYSETAHRFEINDHKRICCTISDRPVLSMVTSMLDKAFDKLPDGTNLICIKAKLKGLPPALHRQQALSAACTIPVPKLCLTFRGHFIQDGFSSLDSFFFFIFFTRARGFASAANRMDSLSTCV